MTNELSEPTTIHWHAWGKRIHGELVGLGFELSASSVWNILHRASIEPAPRQASVSWREFLRQQASAIIECDFSPSRRSGCECFQLCPRLERMLLLPSPNRIVDTDLGRIDVDHPPRHGAVEHREPGELLSATRLVAAGDC